MDYSQSKINETLDLVIEAAFTSGILTDETKKIMSNLAIELRTYRLNMDQLKHIRGVEKSKTILLSFYRKQLEQLVLLQDIQECETCGTIF